MGPSDHPKKEQDEGRQSQLILHYKSVQLCELDNRPAAAVRERQKDRWHETQSSSGWLRMPRPSTWCWRVVCQSLNSCSPSTLSTPPSAWTCGRRWTKSWDRPWRGYWDCPVGSAYHRLSETVQRQDWAGEEVQRWIIQLLDRGEEQQQVWSLRRHVLGSMQQLQHFLVDLGRFRLFTMPWITQIYVTKSQFIGTYIPYR